MKTLCQTLAVAALGLILTGARADTQNINVVVNHQPVDFSGAPPIEVNGSVLVPLRGVFEQLGAHVRYDPMTRTIFAENGSTMISLPLGSETASVNHNPEQLSEPARVMEGTTLVPLRFVAEALGAYVQWHPDTNTVSIVSQTTSSATVTPMASEHMDENLTTVYGRILNIDRSSMPAVVTLRTSSGHVDANITDHTNITRMRDDGTSTDEALSDLHAGQFVTLRQWGSGNARSIEIKAMGDSGTQVRGRIISVDRDSSPTLLTVATANGQVQVGINENTTVNKGATADDEIPSAVEALHVGEHVVARTRADGSAITIRIDD